MVSFDDGSAMIFGGENVHGELLNDLSEFQNGSWSVVVAVGTSPPARADHQAWVQGQGMFVSGGRGVVGGLLYDLWSYDRAAREWTEIGLPAVRPGARYHHLAVHLGDGRTMIVGGVNEYGTALRDSWRYELDGSFTRLGNAPIGIVDACFTFFGDLLVVFGVPGLQIVYDITIDSWYAWPLATHIGQGESLGETTTPQGERVILVWGGQDGGRAESDLVYELSPVNGVLSLRPERLPLPLAASSVVSIPVASVDEDQEVSAGSRLEVGETVLLVFGGLSNGVPVASSLSFDPTVFADGVESGDLSAWSSHLP